METGIKNFPTVYYLSLKESIDRQHDLERQFLDRGISYRMIEGYDGRLVDIRNQLNITGSFVGNRNIPSEVLAVGVSHLRMIYSWYKDTNEEYALFCEDDVNFSLVDHWNFNFKDLIKHLPKDWKVIQMSLIKETPVNWSDMRMRRKKWNDWSCCAYLINREYARQIVRDYYHEDVDTYTLDVRGTSHKPLPENLIYPGDYRQCYVFPFFTENRKHNSTLNRNQEGEYDKIRAIQNQSSEFITTWWKENGKMWKNVREKWQSVFDKDKTIELEKSVDNKPLFSYLFYLAKLLFVILSGCQSVRNALGKM